MKIKKSVIITMSFCFCSSNFVIANLKPNVLNVKDTTKIVSSMSNNKEEKNRNVMMNAENTTGPRNINIGLPFTGDIIILENSIPVVYYYYPTNPLEAWRNDNSLGSMGLMSFTESAIQTGKVGYAVKSDDREFGYKTRGYASLYTNSLGSTKLDMTITGPLGKKGWGYMLSGFHAFDKGTVKNYGYTPWYDNSTMIKAGIQKKYNNGSVRIIYKYMSSKMQLTNYSPLIYNGNGKTSEYPGFSLGEDSYILGNGLVPCFDPYTGEAKFADMGSDEYSKSTTHNIYLDGWNRFKSGILKGWTLKYDAMWQYINSPMSVTFPMSLMSYMTDQQGTDKYYYQGTNKQYSGDVQTVLANMMPQSNNHYLAARAELTKKMQNHDLRFGLNYQRNHRIFTIEQSMYYQTVEPQPQLLDRKMQVAANYYYQVTNSTNGALPASWIGGYGQHTDDTFNKLAFYGSDDWNITNRWSLSYGFRIEHQNKNEKHPVAGYSINNKGSKVYQLIGDADIIDKNFNNDYNYVGAASTTIRLTPNLGLIGEISYNSWVDSYWDYASKDALGNPVADTNGYYQQTTANTNRLNVVNFGGGFYWNLGNTINLVSKITHISKTNNRYNNATITNPSNTSERQNFGPIFYDISTLGWTTDIMANPFKNFQLHYLITWQRPEYKNFSYSAFGVTYDYNGKVIPELSQLLMEIDPSYYMMNHKLRVWFSLRYFGKQYANPTNAFYYNDRWENFGGLDYSVNRNLTVKLQVTNFLNQHGVKGAIQGGDQILDAADYTNRIVSANGIRPRSIELTITTKF